MATYQDFKSIAEKRLNTVDILIANQEWGVAVYMMGFVLECILKALTCKALKLATYPEMQSTKHAKIKSYFLTHDFDMLLIISFFHKFVCLGERSTRMASRGALGPRWSRS